MWARAQFWQVISSTRFSQFIYPYWNFPGETSLFSRVGNPTGSSPPIRQSSTRSDLRYDPILGKFLSYERSLLRSFGSPQLSDDLRQKTSNFSRENFSRENFSSENFSSENFSRDNFSRENFSRENFSRGEFSREMRTLRLPALHADVVTRGALPTSSLHVVQTRL